MSQNESLAIDVNEDKEHAFDNLGPEKDHRRELRDSENKDHELRLWNLVVGDVDGRSYVRDSFGIHEVNVEEDLGDEGMKQG